MSVSRKIFQNVVASSASKIGSTFLALFSLGLITRYLGEGGFGMYITALAFFAFFNALGDWGIYQTFTREISRPNSNENEILSKIFSLRLSVSLLILLIITPLLLLIFPYSREVKVAIFIVSLASSFSSLYQTLVGLFQKKIRMHQLAAVEFGSKIVQASLIYTSIKLDLGFYFVVGMLAVVMLINFVVAFFLAKRMVPFQLQIDLQYWKKFLSQSIPLGLSAILAFLYFKADSIMLSLMQPASDVGVYGAAYKVIENLSFFPAMIVGLTMPLFSLYVLNDKKKFQNIANKNFKIFVILVAPLVIGTMFLADDIIGIIAGPGFVDSANLLRVIIIALAMIFFGNLFNNIMVAANLQKSLFKILLFCSIFNLTLNFWLIPKFSYWSTAFVSAATELFVVLLGGMVIKKNLGYLPKTDKLPAIMIASLVMTGALFVLRNLPFWLSLLTAPIVYFSFLFALKGISKKEITALIFKK
jgi:O-antigen/teichoic acid export membrane protein